jgi:hypothetical protein
VYWNGNKALWEEEKRIAEMAERGEWEEIQKEFNGPKLDSEKHPKWAAIANAMARYEEIEKNPDQFRKTMPGKNTVDEVIGTIQQEWRNAEIDSSDPLVKQVEEKRIAAIESAKKWKSSLSNAKNGGAEPQTDPSKYSKASPETNPKPEEKPAESEKSSTAKNTETTEASKSKTEDTLEEKTPALTIVVPANGSGEFILTETDKHKIDNNAFSEINILALSTLFDGEEEATSNDLKLNLNGNYYDNERNLILKKTVITPPEKEGLKLVKKKEEKKEQKKREKPFWDSFPGGFILIPRGADRADDVRYLVLDKIPGGQGSETLEPWAMKPCERFLKRGSPGEVEISESVVAILKTITRVTGDPPKYRLTLAGDFPLESEWMEDPSGIKLPLSAKVNDEISRLGGQKTQQHRLAKAKKDFESLYANLGKDLFPQFFGPEPKLGEKVIVDKKNPKERNESPKVIATFAEFVDKDSVSHLDRFTKYVADLFTKLNELASDDPRHASANADFERLIKSPRDLKAEGSLTLEAVGWIEVTKLSKNEKNKWGDSTATSASVLLAQTKEDKDQIRKDFQRKYFDDFFRVWNERFSEEAVKKLIDDLNLIQATQALPSPEQLDSTLKTLEATKSRLENNDLTDDGEYTLELMLETPNPASSPIPLIRGTR